MIGYLGQEGSYTFHSCLEFTDKDKLIPFNNIGRLFYALDRDEVSGIVVPFENMKEGTSFDVLGRMRRRHYHISREVVLEIILNVVSKEHNSENIDKIYATELSINECYNNLKQELGKYQKNYVKSDIDAKEQLLRMDNSGAVLSNFETLGQYNVVLSNIRDTRLNTHKFVHITKSLNVNGLHNRTFIACSPRKNKVGALYDILHEFVLRGININKILSNPTKSKDDDIILYIELDGNLEDKMIKESLGIVKFKTKFVSILGSYLSK